MFFLQFFSTFLNLFYFFSLSFRVNKAFQKRKELISICEAEKH
jgi:uncharacterized membrane protein